MALMTLAKALKHRKRLAQRIAQVDQRANRNNSILVGNTREVSVRDLLAERAKLVEQLVVVKLAIVTANVGIQERIFRISELKGAITSLQQMDTKNGKQEAPYQSQPPVYEAELTKADVERLVAELEARIDRLQEEVDQYNYATEVEVPAVEV